MSDLRLRLHVVGIVVATCFVALFARLGHLQLLQSERLQRNAVDQLVKTVKIPTVRGKIYDRRGRVLVDNRLVSVVEISKQELTKKQRPIVLSRLSQVLGVPFARLDAELADPTKSQVLPIPVFYGPRESAEVYIAEHPELFPGVRLSETAERVYPYAQLAAHVLGYVGSIREDEINGQPSELLYDERDVFGKSGVEWSFEGELRGRPGQSELLVDRVGRQHGSLQLTPPVPGRDLYLTIDIDVQKLVEDSLLQGLRAAREYPDSDRGKFLKAPAGAAVVLDIRDGSALAIASYPTYDPEDFVGGISVALNDRLQDPTSDAPLNNRAIQGLYAPGSTFKPFTSLAAMVSGLIGEYTPYQDLGYFKLPSCPAEVRCIFYNAGRVPHGQVDLRRALTVSSDAYYYWIGQRFWEEVPRSERQRIQDVARKLGLGERSGILLRSEHVGRIPDEATKKRLHDTKPKAFPDGKWRTGDNINIAIGQGEMVITPLQLAVGYAALSNGGSVIRPKIAMPDSAVRALKGAATLDPRDSYAGPPDVRRRITLTDALIRPIIDGLVGVQSQEQGTAFEAFRGFPLDTYPVAGKTGTAQVSGKQDNAIYAAFAPADAPRYVVVVFMEESGFGGQSAAPVARRIFEGIFGLQTQPVRIAIGTRE